MRRNSPLVVVLSLLASVLFIGGTADAATTVPSPPATEVLGLDDTLIAASGDGRFAFANTVLGFVRVDLYSEETVVVAHGAYRAWLTDDGSSLFMDTPEKILPADTNDDYSIYRYTFATDTYSLLNVPSPHPDWYFNLEDISGDGRFVALSGSNPVFADTGAFVLDTGTNTLRQPDTLLPDFAIGVQRQSSTIRLSADGRYAAWSTNPFVGCTSCAEVWVYDWQSNTAVNATTRVGGGDLTDGNAFAPALSSDGRNLIFRSNASGLAPGVATVGWRVYARNLASLQTVVVTEDESDQDYGGPQVGPGGNTVVVMEDLDSTFEGNHYLTAQPVLYDMVAGTRAVLSDPAGAAVPNGSAKDLLLSRNGLRILFTSFADNFAAVTPAAPGEVPLRTFSVVLSPLLPSRILDTRPGSHTDDGRFEGGGRLAANGTLQLVVGGRRNIPTNSKAVVLNVTAIQPVDGPGYGYVTAYPCGIGLPNASTVNLIPGRVVANMAFAELGAGGAVCLFSNVAVDLIVDAFYVFPVDSEVVPVDPQRMLDTRVGPATVDGLFKGTGVVPAMTELELQLSGRGDIPLNAKAVALNITTTGATGDGYVTVHPCGAALPNASVANYQAGMTKASMTVVALSAAGKVCLLTSQPAHLLADAVGYFADLPGNPSEYVSFNPARLVDTRVGSTTIDHLYEGTGVHPAGGTLSFRVAGRGDVPAGTSTVVLDVVAAASGGNGYVTVYPCGQPMPSVSSVNMLQGGTVNNHVVVETGVGGAVCMFASDATHLIVDVEGVLP